MTITKTLTSVVTALVLGGALLAPAAPAQAEWKKQNQKFAYKPHQGGNKLHHGGFKHHNGGVVAAGVLGALALGAVASGPYYASSGCYMTSRTFVDKYGYVYERPVRVCD